MSKLEIKKFGVLSSGKIYASTMAVMSLLVCIPYGLFAIFFGLALAGAGGRNGMAAAGGGIIGALFVIILGPIIYGILGFIIGVIGAFVYNIIAGMIGGLEIEVEEIY